MRILIVALILLLIYLLYSQNGLEYYQITNLSKNNFRSQVNDSLKKYKEDVAYYDVNSEKYYTDIPKVNCLTYPIDALEFNKGYGKHQPFESTFVLMN